MFGRKQSKLIGEEPLHVAAMSMVRGYQAGQSGQVWQERVRLGEFEHNVRASRASAFWVEAMGAICGLHEGQIDNPLVTGGLERARRLIDSGDQSQREALARVERFMEQEQVGR